MRQPRQAAAGKREQEELQSTEQVIGQNTTKLHQQVIGEKSLVTRVPLDKPKIKKFPTKRNERNVSGRE